MKNIVTTICYFLVSACFCTVAVSQGKNSVRAGAGVNIHTPGTYAGTSAVGQSVFAEYSREFSRYISASVNLHTDMTYVGERWNGHDIGLSLRGMVTPFASVGWLGWIEVGVGLSGDYRIDSRENGIYHEDGVDYYHQEQFRTFLFGFDFPVRAYVIDSPRFELFAFCDIRTAFQDGTFGIHHYDAGISFGVKS